MPDLREQLQACLQGRVCLVGVGNADQGDDGFGVRLAESLKSEIRNPKSEARALAPEETSSDYGLRASFGFRISDFGFEVLVAHTTPERRLARLTDGAFDHILFLDAVDFGGAPGSVVLLEADEIKARFPQISTHRISLGLLAQLVEAGVPTKVRLLGVQPESLKPGHRLSPAVEASLCLLRDLLLGLLEAKERLQPEGCVLPC